ncbi:thioredoxin family protein [Flavobacterium panacagri]|uniref:thioredoxin family protein n=1 Tax=Flavobacterium panacagri TaxID=3034146 RepID=UPI0025A57589|nr:thioredoxin family protein [Flavobacterium panacagri]
MLQKLLILLFFLSSFFINAQGPIWRTDINDAVAISSEQRKPLMILFTGQGANPKLQSEIFSTKDFETWAQRNVVLVKLDLSDPSISDQIKEQNLRLKSAFGIEEIPQVCFTEVTVRKGRTNFNKLGLISYISLGVKAWISESNLILHPE